jgi:hypothetical protein
LEANDEASLILQPRFAAQKTKSPCGKRMGFRDFSPGTPGQGYRLFAAMVATQSSMKRMVNKEP